MKVVITGSHFTPAQAVIEELIQRDDFKIIYFGRKYTREGDASPSVESQVLPKLGVKFIPIVSGRLQRTFTPYSLISLLRVPIGFFQSFYLLIREKPDLVVSFGGYVGVPVIVAAWLLSIPIMVHEQTLVVGLANQLGALFASKIAVSFQDSLKNYSENAVLTGNPLRKELTQVEKGDFNKSQISSDISSFIKEAKEKNFPVVLVTGGNQGSHIINQTIETMLSDLTRKSYIIHQTGDSKYYDFERLSEIGRDLHQNRYLVKKWIDSLDWGYILKNCDLAISRGGMNTLQELAFFGVPAIVIPLPIVARDEQIINANFYGNLGLVKILPQSKLLPNALLEMIEDGLKNINTYNKSASFARDSVIVDAAKRIALEILILAEKRDSKPR